MIMPIDSSPSDSDYDVFARFGKESNRLGDSDYPDDQNYLHGTGKKEQARLGEQANLFADLIHSNLDLSDVKSVLEIGAGTGEQTQQFVKRNQHIKRVIAVDVSKKQLMRAYSRAHVHEFKDKVTFLVGDARNLRSLQYLEDCIEEAKGGAKARSGALKEGLLDVAFFCWTLEHIPDPLIALSEARRVLKPGGRIIFREVNNQSFVCFPKCKTVMEYWRKVCDLQVEQGGDPDVGIRLNNLLRRTGYHEIVSNKRVVRGDYVHNRPKLVALIDFWSGLLDSAFPALEQDGKTNMGELEAAKQELESLKTDKNAVIDISYVEAEARTAWP